MCLQREPTVRVVAVSSPPPLRYFSVSKGGQTTVWSSGLHALTNLRVSVCCSPSVDGQEKQTSMKLIFLMQLAGDPTEEVANTKRFRGWTTDAVSMANAHKVAIATDCRDLHFINVSTSSVFEDVHLFGKPDFHKITPKCSVILLLFLLLCYARNGMRGELRTLNWQ